jgi:UDP-N-acetylglucosamine transferase subunit ALG13
MIRPDDALSRASKGQGRSALLTVGSTSFPDLIAAVLARPALNALRAAGFDELLVQYGRSALPPGWISTGRPATGLTPEGLTVTPFSFRDGIEDLYPGVDLVISHAGASLRPSSPALLTVLRGLTVSPTIRLQVPAPS